MTFKDNIHLETLNYIRNDTNAFIETVEEFGHCTTNKNDDLYISEKMNELKKLREKYFTLLDELNDKMVACYGN